MKVGRLKVIFRLPDSIPSMMDGATAAWPKEHLAYVEWLMLSKEPGQHHNMYSVTKAIVQPTDIVPGDIVSLSTIHQSCHIIPHLNPKLYKDADLTWPSSWKSTNVLDLCNSFLLNNWSSKFAYQMLW